MADLCSVTEFLGRRTNVS